MNPASNFACYRTMFKVATESKGERVSIFFLRPWPSASIQKSPRHFLTQSSLFLMGHRSSISVGHQTPFSAVHFALPAKCAVSPSTLPFLCASRSAGLCVSCAFPVVRQWCVNCYCYFTFSLNSQSLSSACLSKMCIFLTRVTPTGWYFFQLLLLLFFSSCMWFHVYLITFGFLFADFPMDT